MAITSVSSRLGRIRWWVDEFDFTEFKLHREKLTGGQASETAAATPARGERPAEHRAEFHGKAMHDPHGREAPRGRR
jgi:hypothetical protein